MGEEQGMEGVRPVHRERRVAHHDVLSVVGGVGFGEGEDGGGRTRGQKSAVRRRAAKKSR